MRLNHLLLQILLLFMATAAGSDGLVGNAVAACRPSMLLAKLNESPLSLRQLLLDADWGVPGWQPITAAAADKTVYDRFRSWLESVNPQPPSSSSGSDAAEPPVSTGQPQPDEAALPGPLLAGPQPLSLFPESNPAPLRPILTWTKVAGAVCYELEINAAPVDPAAAATQPLFVTREIFANGYHVDLSRLAGQPLFWRVRGLDYAGNPISFFSKASQIIVDPSKNAPLNPLPTARYNENKRPTPLYPVYYWIPLAGAAAYEVEVTSRLPENPGGIAASAYRIWSRRATGYGIYDDTARSHPGTYYWRVRALDAQGEPLGVYSDAVPCKVDLTAGNYAASLGDSITHGGGAVSYSPADWEYSYQTYLNFPLVNLGKSGDTAATMLERFEQDVLPFQPRYLLILGGTNSLRGGTPAAAVIADLAAIRDKCIAHGIRPIFLTLPPINPAAIAMVFQESTAAKWRAEFAQVNRFIRRQRYYIDLEPHFLDERRELPERFAVDGLHIDIKGKRLIGNVINQAWHQVAE